MTGSESLVFGEPVGPLHQAVLASLVTGPSEGAERAPVVVDLTLPGTDVLRRAVLRAEAELCLLDAERIGTAADPVRFGTQRLRDALHVVVQALVASWGAGSS